MRGKIIRCTGIELLRRIGLHDRQIESLTAAETPDRRNTTPAPSITKPSGWELLKTKVSGDREREAAAAEEILRRRQCEDLVREIEESEAAIAGCKRDRRLTETKRQTRIGSHQAVIDRNLVELARRDLRRLELFILGRIIQLHPHEHLVREIEKNKEAIARCERDRRRTESTRQLCIAGHQAVIDRNLLELVKHNLRQLEPFILDPRIVPLQLPPRHSPMRRFLPPQ